MQQKFSPVIKADELLRLFKAAKEFAVFDASSGKDAAENYNKKHIVGALYVDLNTQMADIKVDVANGGRHPLPTPGIFSQTLNGFGIGPNSHVVIYDDKNASNAAARFWWMLRSAGIAKVQVLDGGFEAALKAGVPVNPDKVIPEKTKRFSFEKWRLPIADIHEIDRISGDKNFLVIDVRDSERFTGKKENIDLVAGHIPGATNVPFSTNLDSEGFYLSPGEMKNKYEKVLENKIPENIIVHCGSGVTACHTLLAMAYAGLQIPKLYVGSWSEWSRNKREVATGK